MFFLYLILWLVLSMEVNIPVLITGILISLLVYVFACMHMRHKISDDIKLIRNIFLGIKYVFTLVWETAKANVMVFRIVFSKKIKIDPCLIYFYGNLKTNSARVALANSITLTPGTIAVSLNDDFFCVHCLNREMAMEVGNSVFARQLKRIEEN